MLSITDNEFEDMKLGYWPQHPVCRGLIRLDITLIAGRALPIEGYLEIFLQADAASTFNKHVFITTKEYKASFVFATHLVPNGPCIVIVQFRSDTGSITAKEIQVNIENKGDLAEKVRVSLKRSWQSPFTDKACDSSLFDYSDAKLIPWFDRPNASAYIDAKLVQHVITEEEAAILRQFVKDGYAEIPGVIDQDHLQRLNESLDEAIANKWQDYEYGSSKRLQHLHLHFPAIRDLWLHPRILHILSLIFDTQPAPCQTLTYVFGSQQRPHQDTIHLTPFPAGYMCGVWVALQDVEPDSGELVVYPGSHTLPRLYTASANAAKVSDSNFDYKFRSTVGECWQSFIRDGGFEPVYYRPRRGSVLIWHENLIHGGSKRIDLTKPRRSIVSHYFAEGGIAYYDSSGQVAYLDYIDNIG